MFILSIWSRIWRRPQTPPRLHLKSKGVNGSKLTHKATSIHVVVSFKAQPTCNSMRKMTISMRWERRQVTTVIGLDVLGGISRSAKRAKLNGIFRPILDVSTHVLKSMQQRAKTVDIQSRVVPAKYVARSFRLLRRFSNILGRILERSLINAM
jgi:hypothetical protein